MKKMNQETAFRLLQRREKEKEEMLRKLPRSNKKERAIVREAIIRANGHLNHDGSW